MELLQGLYRAKKCAEGKRLSASAVSDAAHNQDEEAGGVTEGKTGEERDGENGGESGAAASPRPAARLLEAQAIDKELNANGSSTKYPVEGCD